MSWYVPSEEEARRVGGSNLIAPKTAKVRAGKNGEVKRWDEMCTVDDFVVSEEEEKFLEAFAAELAEAKKPSTRESIRIQLRVSDKVPSDNAGRVLSDFNHFWWGLGIFDDLQLKEWAETLNGQDPRSTLQGKFYQMQGGARRLGGFLKAVGLQDRLVNRSIFRGVGTIVDRIAVIPGQTVNVTFEQGEDREGTVRDNVRAYKAR